MGAYGRMPLGAPFLSGTDGVAPALLPWVAHTPACVPLCVYRRPGRNTTTRRLAAYGVLIRPVARPAAQSDQRGISPSA